MVMGSNASNKDKASKQLVEDYQNLTENVWGMIVHGSYTCHFSLDGPVLR